MDKRKTFIIDTNIILHDPESLHAFGKYVVVLPMDVIEELDGFKRKTGELANNARKTIRTLDALRANGQMMEGVPLPNGGICKIMSTEFVGEEFKELVQKQQRSYFSRHSSLRSSERVLALAYKLTLMKDHGEVILVTKNISTRLKADMLGVRVEDYRLQKVELPLDKMYKGYQTFDVSSKKFIQFQDTLNAVTQDYQQILLSRKSSKVRKDLIDDPTEEPNSLIQMRQVLADNGIKPGSVRANEFLLIRNPEKQILVARYCPFRRSFFFPSVPLNPLLNSSDSVPMNLHPSAQTDDENSPKTSVKKENKDETDHPHFYNLLPCAMVGTGKIWNISARSPHQAMALEILTDPKLKLITLVGQAGTGKTLLALAAALEGVFKYKLYDKILVSRPVVPMGKDIGFLPGGKDEKLLPWMQPIYDNLEFLTKPAEPAFSVSITNKFELLELEDHNSNAFKKPRKPLTKNKSKKKAEFGKQKQTEEDLQKNELYIQKIQNAKYSDDKDTDEDVTSKPEEESDSDSDEELYNPGRKMSVGFTPESVTLERAMSKIQMEAITYIRGRSIIRQFIIVDEAQNLTPHEVKTIISRAGEGTKMILTGDPDQIDNPYLDATTNGLTYVVEKLKGVRIHAHVTLNKSERSELAALAATML